MFLEQWQAGNPWLQQQCHPPYPFHHCHAASICQKSPLGRFHPVLSHSVTNPAWQNKSHMYVKPWWITWNHLMQSYLLPSLTLYNCNPLFLSLTMNMQFFVHWVQDDREAKVDFHGDTWTNLPIKKNGFSHDLTFSWAHQGWKRTEHFGTRHWMQDPPLRLQMEQRCKMEETKYF